MKTILLLLALAAVSIAQSPVPYPFPSNSPNNWQVGIVTLPSATKSVIAQTTFLQKGWFSNRTASAVTVTITDNTTACTGATACQVWPTVSIPANTAQKVDFGGVVANSGVSWFASSANAVDGWIQGSY